MSLPERVKESYHSSICIYIYIGEINELWWLRIMNNIKIIPKNQSMNNWIRYDIYY
jgi:hypothetical protein